MTKEQVPVDHQLKSLTVSEPPKEQQQPAPFHIILVDIKQAAEKRKITCVEIPLSDENLEFVALSYRWGELEETIIDTQLGYLANITSFDLSHFYVLCQMMLTELELQSIPYVWVDAICVDQNNPVKRKATIYQMTNIYKRANHILAVPDLHLRHLMNSGGTAIDERIRGVREYSDYIYYLINGNIDKLYELDEEWLDEINVPKNHHLRQSLATHTDHFVDGIMDLPLHHDNDSDVATMTQDDLLDSVKKAIDASAASNLRSEFVCISPAMRALFRQTYPSAVNINQVRTTCWHPPLDNDNNDHTSSNMTVTLENESDWLHCVLQQVKQDEWKQLISQRTESIRQSISFLIDLITDWATRVWVISEYSISKNKQAHKLKFWFVQMQYVDREGFPFFEFDFSLTRKTTNDNDSDSDMCIFNNNNHQHSHHHALTAKAEGMYRHFHNTMIWQLRDQSFLEMVLKAKASKNEDRFYSVLPLSEYKHLMKSKEVVSGWHITNLLGVKLKLLDFMSPKDKLNLLYLIYQSPSKCLALPTFATLLLVWPTPKDYHSMALSCSQEDINFDLTDGSTAIQLSYDSTMNLDKLTLRPTEYHSIKASEMLYDEFYVDKKPLFEALGLDYKNKKKNPLHVVLIARYKEHIMKSNLIPGDIRRKRLHLVGSFAKNKWMITGSTEIEVVVSRYTHWEYHSTTEDDTGFDIY